MLHEASRVATGTQTTDQAALRAAAWLGCGLQSLRIGDADLVWYRRCHSDGIGRRLWLTIVVRYRQHYGRRVAGRIGDSVLQRHRERYRDRQSLWIRDADLVRYRKCDGCAVCRRFGLSIVVRYRQHFNLRLDRWIGDSVLQRYRQCYRDRQSVRIRDADLVWKRVAEGSCLARWVRDAILVGQRIGDVDWKSFWSSHTDLVGFWIAVGQGGPVRNCQSIVHQHGQHRRTGRISGIGIAGLECIVQPQRTSRSIRCGVADLVGQWRPDVYSRRAVDAPSKEVTEMIITAGETPSIRVQIVDDSGIGVTALNASTFPPVYYVIDGPNAAVQITLADLPLITSPYSQGGVHEYSGGNYRLDLPAAAVANAGTSVSLYAEATHQHLLCDRIDVSPSTVSSVTVSLAVPPAVAVASQTPSLIPCVRGDTLRFTLPPMGSLVGRSQLIFTAKFSVNDPDSAAAFQIIEGTGMTICNVASFVAGNGSLTVADQNAGTVLLEVDAVITSVLAIRDLVWDCQVKLASGVSSPIGGTIGMTADVTRST